MRHGLAGAAAALGLVGGLALGGCSAGDEGRYAAEPVRVAEVVERVSAPGAVQAAGQAELKGPAAGRGGRVGGRDGEPGGVQAAGQAELKAPAAARVERLVVKDGQQVRSGQLVAELSSEQVDDQV